MSNETKLNVTETAHRLAAALIDTIYRDTPRTDPRMPLLLLEELNTMLALFERSHWIASRLSAPFVWAARNIVSPIEMRRRYVAAVTAAFSEALNVDSGTLETRVQTELTYMGKTLDRLINDARSEVDLSDLCPDGTCGACDQERRRRAEQVS